MKRQHWPMYTRARYTTNTCRASVDRARLRSSSRLFLLDAMCRLAKLFVAQTAHVFGLRVQKPIESGERAPTTFLYLQCLFVINSIG